MSCTTLLVGKKASYDGSTMIARNEDAGFTAFTPKKFIVVLPEEQPRHYRSVISHVEIDLPDDPLRYTAMINANPIEGLWAAAGVNAANISMTATETITTNDRVLAADPMVKLQKAESGTPEIPGGIGEEDFVTLVLPYIRSAREGVLRTGQLLEQYGTYESNGMAFSDSEEIWWLETVGGHHWIAARVPDDCYAVAPNYFNIDNFDLKDAFGAKKNFLCSEDLREFVDKYHLNLNQDAGFNPRLAFGSHTDADHSYNTPRSWYIEKYFNPHSAVWEGEQADFTPRSDDIPWIRVPENKITVFDVKYALSAYYQGTDYNPYGHYGDGTHKGELRPIGINRNNFLSLTQIRPDFPAEIAVLEWVAMASNPFNAFVPFYANVDRTPEYLANTTTTVSTDNFYWVNRILGPLADASYSQSIQHIERYQNNVQSEASRLIHCYDAVFIAGNTNATELCEKANDEIAALTKTLTDEVLQKVLLEATNGMKNKYSRADT